MRRFFVLMLTSPALVVLPTPAAHASGTVTLRPGSEITITPGETTTIRCEGRTEQSSFCRCAYTPRLGYYLERLTLVNNEWQAHMLGQHSSDGNCQSALNSHPSCRFR